MATLTQYSQQAALKKLPDCLTAKDARTAIRAALAETDVAANTLWADSGLIDARDKAFSAIFSSASIKEALGFDEGFWPWSIDPTYCKGTPQRNAVIKMIGSLYANAVASVDMAEVKQTAVKQLGKDLVHDLTSPSRYWAVIKPYALFIVVILVLVLALQVRKVVT